MPAIFITVFQQSAINRFLDALLTQPPNPHSRQKTTAEILAGADHCSGDRFEEKNFALVGFGALPVPNMIGIVGVGTICNTRIWARCGACHLG